jgi:sporulation protein YlmC with PRC-barrel domain
MMLFSAALGRKVVSTSTAETVGFVEEFVVDPRTHSVVALGLKKAKGGVLRWSDLTAFGEDAVTVASAEQVGSADETITALSGKDHRLVGKRVLSTAGDELGTVADVEFDPASAALTALALAERSIDAVRLVGVGSYAVVVRAQEQEDQR